MVPSSQPRILVVDDEYSIRSSIAEMIEMFGFFSENAASAQEALEYLQKNPQTDIVLLDIDLGVGLSGIELLPIIREKYKYVQVIMFTSQNSLEMAVECLKKGAVDYLTKPFREKEFLKKAPIALERKKLAQLNDLYLGILVHDLNNPVQYILGALELLKASAWTNFNDSEKDIFRTAEKGLGQIRTMVNNILTISKIENGIISLGRETFSLSKEMGDVLKLFEDDLANSDRKLSMQLPQNDLITTDKELFSRVFLNITANAVRYTPREGEISISAVNPNGLLTVSVTNTGSFIEEDMREMIFDKFAGVHLAQKSTGVQNFGLGLTFSKMAIQAMDGNIWVDGDSRVPQTTFHFTIKNRKDN
jgi:two-component system sensor histidine kinase/response regulator